MSHTPDVYPDWFSILLLILAVSFLLQAFLRNGRSALKVGFVGTMLVVLLAPLFLLGGMSTSPQPKETPSLPLADASSTTASHTSFKVALQSDAAEEAIPVAGGDAAADEGENSSDTATDEVKNRAELPSWVKLEESADSNDDQTPAWVNRLENRQQGVTRVAISSEYFAQGSQCRAHLNQRLFQFTQEYMENLLGAERARLAKFPAHYLNREVVKKTATEKREFAAPTGEMLRMHALLEFDDARLRDDWKVYQQAALQEQQAEKARGRVTYAGLWLAVVLSLIGIPYSYLKLDTATRGYYTGRLKVAAGAMTLLAIGGSLALVRWGSVL